MVIRNGILHVECLDGRPAWTAGAYNEGSGLFMWATEQNGHDEVEQYLLTNFVIVFPHVETCLALEQGTANNFYRCDETLNFICERRD